MSLICSIKDVIIKKPEYIKYIAIATAIFFLIIFLATISKPSFETSAQNEKIKIKKEIGFFIAACATCAVLLILWSLIDKTYDINSNMGYVITFSVFFYNLIYGAIMVLLDKIMDTQSNTDVKQNKTKILLIPMFILVIPTLFVCNQCFDYLEKMKYVGKVFKLIKLPSKHGKVIDMVSGYFITEFLVTTVYIIVILANTQNEKLMSTVCNDKLPKIQKEYVINTKCSKNILDDIFVYTLVTRLFGILVLFCMFMKYPRELLGKLKIPFKEGLKNFKDIRNIIPKFQKKNRKQK